MEIIWAAVSRRPSVTESPVQCHLILCWICGRQIGTGTNFSLSSSVSPIIIPPVFYTHTFLEYRAVQPSKLPASLNIIIIRHQLGLDRQVWTPSDGPLLKGLRSLLLPLKLERIKYYVQISTSLNKATKIRCTHVHSVGKMQGSWMVKQAVYIITTVLRRVNKLCWTEW
jgi:hypothetical protein